MSDMQQQTRDETIRNTVRLDQVDRQLARIEKKIDNLSDHLIQNTDKTKDDIADLKQDAAVTKQRLDNTVFAWLNKHPKLFVFFVVFFFGGASTAGVQGTLKLVKLFFGG